ncbi:MAG: DNA alkylation repair protein [Polyangiaceae bacterium]|nr:DNA alkylation repair protein [Polyangiaceae bacterium]
MPKTASAKLNAATVLSHLSHFAEPKRAANSQWFFKTGKGQYGEGDVFMGVTVPNQRSVARKFAELPPRETLKLLHSKLHEARLTALLILVHQFERGSAEQQAEIAKLYLANTSRINNWDLVDSSAPHILGHWLLNKDRKLLLKLARSRSLWERRIAIIATFEFLRHGQHRETFAISELLLSDKEDLIHKAVGWMLREAGKNVGVQHLRAFLKKHANKMPRTALRYATEHLSAEERAQWLKYKGD